MRCFLILLILSVQLSISQNSGCTCTNDLDYLIENVKEASSFKSQLKDEDFHNAYIEALKETIQKDVRIELNCLAYLQKYLKIVKDNHLYIGKSENNIDSSQYFPIQDNLESIKRMAIEDTGDDITGIYNLQDLYRVAVVKDSVHSYKGIILETTNETWKVGQIKFVLDKTEDGLEGIFYNGIQQASFMKIKYKNGRLYPEQWVKENKKEFFTYNPYVMDSATFQYRLLKDDVHYIRLGNFSGMTSNYNEAKQLLTTMERKIISGNVIVDLRNNGGGGPRTSDLFRKFFRKNKKSLNLYVIQNMYCGSDCEQFLLKLKDQQLVNTYGENTRGALAYGFGNYDSPSFTTPCYDYTFGITTTKYEEYIQYEVVGIPPDVSLNTHEDWIEQIVRIIE